MNSIKKKQKCCLTVQQFNKQKREVHIGKKKNEKKKIGHGLLQDLQQKKINRVIRTKRMLNHDEYQIGKKVGMKKKKN